MRAPEVPEIDRVRDIRPDAMGAPIDFKPSDYAGNQPKRERKDVTPREPRFASPLVQTKLRLNLRHDRLTPSTVDRCKRPILGSDGPEKHCRGVARHEMVLVTVP